MFSRRRGSSVTQPVDQSTSSNATAAATQAFIQTSRSMNSLSSAAAAAALRSQTTSPEPVANVQTKRMARRASTSSTGSGNGARGGLGRGGLQRTNSNGSMTKRTFRTPSPARANGTMPPASPGSDVPPIPAIPANARIRASSAEPPQRITSPTPTAGKRGSSVDRASMPPTSSSRPTKRLSNVAEAEEAERLNNAFSRNFSRPMSPSQSPVTEAPPKKYTHKSDSWFTGPATTSTPARPMTSDGLPPSIIPASTMDVPLAASKPVKKNRISSSQGSHLARANSTQSRASTSTVDTSYEAADSVMVYDPNTRTFTQKRREQPQQPPSPQDSKSALVYDPNTRSVVPSAEARRGESGNILTARQPEVAPPPTQTARRPRQVPAPLNTQPAPPPKNPARQSQVSPSPTSPRATGFLQKYPSLVREDPEAEQEAELASPVSNNRKDVRKTVQTYITPAKAYTAPTTTHKRSASLDVPRPEGSGARGRNTSISPQRSAHFSQTPILQSGRHVPPPRDVSPAKSALKHSPASSERGNSPMARFSPLWTTAGPPSETSDETHSQDGLGSVRKKKSVRVSFDERAQEIAPVNAQSTPQTVAATEDEEDDGMMKPRPALPSFGSIRKNRVQPEMAEKVTEMPPERHEPSSDRAIGGILRNRLEPSPPEVTSREGTSYVSDDSSDAEVPAVASAATPKPAEVGAVNEAAEPRVKDFAEASSMEQDVENTAGENLNVPGISLQPPTPGLEDESKRDPMEHQEEQKEENFEARPEARKSLELVMPGGWTEEVESEDKAGSTPDQPVVEPSPQTPEPTTVDRRASTEDSAATQTVTPLSIPPLQSSPQMLSDISEDSDDSAEFSDAMEDASDFEDGGFASLDAIVKSPTVSPSPAEPRAKMPAAAESPTPKPTPTPAEGTDKSTSKPSDWGEATTYWSKLTRERREQLEREHFSSDDEGPPATATALAKKPRPKKSPATGAPTAVVTSTGAPKQTAPWKQSAPSTQQVSTTPSMRKSMREQSGPVATISGGRSMRSGGSTMSTDSRQGASTARPQSEYIESRGALQKKSLRPASSTGLPSSSTGPSGPSARPQSSSGPTAQETSYPALATKRASLQKRQDPPQASSRVQREISHDSDSESSFRKKRRGSSSMDTQGRYSMKRSMRAGSIDSTSAPIQRPTSPSNAGRFSIRSLSPTGSFWGRKKGEPLRPSSIDAGPRTTMRGPPAARERGSRLPTSSKPTVTTAPTSKSRFKSRFADSDDEDEDARPTRSFRSRFADSDDDEPAPLRPVRGIPRQQGRDDGDSTDLSDEDDDPPRNASGKREKMALPMVPDPSDVEKAMAAAKRNLGMTDGVVRENNEGDTLRKGTLRAQPQDQQGTTPSSPSTTAIAPTERKKKGFMGSILRRNRNSSSAVPQTGQAGQAQVPASPILATPSSTQGEKQEAPSNPSTPTRGKLVRKRSDQPTMRRGDSYLSTAPAASSNTSSPAARKEPENWPLPPAIPETDGASQSDRPNTSDGVSPEVIKLAHTMRPDLAPRSKSGQQLNTGNRVRIQAGEEGSEPGERSPKDIYSRRTGKKKKFSMLRRAFGIDD
ncbi:hypothetical protein LTR37_004090 [Vermiconidia calcicola]|uniref:Uncharacterized protein n=1 Tax=Vermiconidia calcicola TaxID=1690605 RepID=A0ACC3NNF2_9PEZI|nr:hypothetical protein LTR37_004090 [Vermiconidia calcicola]